VEAIAIAGAVLALAVCMLPVQAVMLVGLALWLERDRLARFVSARRP